MRSALDTAYRDDSRQILATLIRLLGDFDLAEEALQDAFAAALHQWPSQGIPSSPRAWLVSTGRFKGIDAMRRRARYSGDYSEVLESFAAVPERAFETADQVGDDDLRLIFTCCHPALSQEARVALTLKEVCGLTTEEIARSLLVSPSTVAQRIVRAKQKIREAKIPYVVPSTSELPERLDAVLQVIYLVFNEGYSATSGAQVTRADLSGEAIRLGRLLEQHLPQPEVTGLLALMLLQESRRFARSSSSGDLVLLQDQDRSLWNQDLIVEGQKLVQRALQSRSFGPYTLQATIAAVHSEAKSAAETDWVQIVGLYDVLLRICPSPVIELNRAVAVAMAFGPSQGLEIIDIILERGDLDQYYLAHSARADLYRRLGKTSDAKRSYMRALELTQQNPERRFLQSRLDELASISP